MTTRSAGPETGAAALRTTPSDARLLWLRRVVLAVGAAWTAFFVAFLPITINESVAGDSVLGRLLLWGHGGDEYLAMIVAINLVIGVALLWSARDPLAHGQTIDLCLAINSAHLATMAIMGLLGHGHHLHLVGDVALGVVSTAALAAAWLPVRRFAQ